MKILQASIWMLDLRVKERLIECLKIGLGLHRESIERDLENRGKRWNRFLFRNKKDI